MGVVQMVDSNPKGEESCCTGTYECRGARGEAERDNGPVDRCPAERARHGRCAPGFRAKQDSVVEESAGATSLSATPMKEGRRARPSFMGGRKNPHRFSL